MKQFGLDNAGEAEAQQVAQIDALIGTLQVPSICFSSVAVCDQRALPRDLPHEVSIVAG